MSLPPKEIPLGAMRFNSDSQKLEYFNGDVWMQIHTFSPNLNGGARGIFAGGWRNVPSTARSNVIEFVTISTTGNTTDFGELSRRTSYIGTCSSRTRGIIAGGNANDSPSAADTIEYITISSTGDSVSFGSLPLSINGHYGHSNLSLIHI